MSGGKKKTKRDELLEAVADFLESANYEECPAHLFWAMREMEQPIYGRKVEIGHDLYGKARIVDFACYHPTKWPQCLVIQCRWQASSGSVDAKYPFEVLSIQQNEYPTIIVADGGGASNASIMWLRGQQGKNQLKHVCTLSQFQQFNARGSL